MRGKYKKKKEPKTPYDALTDLIIGIDYANEPFKFTGAHTGRMSSDYGWLPSSHYQRLDMFRRGAEYEAVINIDHQDMVKQHQDWAARVLHSTPTINPGMLEQYIKKTKMEKEKTWKEKIYDRATSKEVRYSILHGVTETREKNMDMRMYDNDLRKLKNTIWEACYGLDVPFSYGAPKPKQAYRKQDIDLIKMFMNKRPIHEYSHNPDVIHEKILKYYDEENMAEIIPKKVLLKTVLFRLLLEEEYLDHPVIQNYSDSAKRVASYALATIDRKNKIDHFSYSNYDSTMIMLNSDHNYNKVSDFEMSSCCEKHRQITDCIEMNPWVEGSHLRSAEHMASILFVKVVPLIHMVNELRVVFETYKKLNPEPAEIVTIKGDFADTGREALRDQIKLKKLAAGYGKLTIP